MMYEIWFVMRNYKDDIYCEEKIATFYNLTRARLYVNQCYRAEYDKSVSYEIRSKVGNKHGELYRVVAVRGRKDKEIASGLTYLDAAQFCSDHDYQYTFYMDDARAWDLIIDKM